jgi:DNA-binding IclR family transcriptional regulator
VSSIQVIDRSASLINAIAAAEQPLSLKILSAETGLHPSTAFRILGALGEVGFVERDSAGHYLLGRKLLHLAGRVRRGVDIREEARDVMEALRDRIGETVNLTVREGDEVIYIERVTPKRMMRVEQVIGSRAPLHVTAVGKLMLGELGDAFVVAYAERSGLPSYTRHTIKTLQALLQEAHRAMQDGYALDNEEAEEGVGCIGTLIHDSSGAIVAGLSISAPMERRRDEWIALVRQAGRQVSERLGYRGV